MTEGVVVRRATAADLPTIVEFRLALLDEHSDNPLYGNLRGDAIERARELYRGQLAASNEVMFVADRAGVIVGLIRCVDTPSSPLLLPSRYCYVSSVYVRQGHRRTGVLRAMLGRAIEWCLERGLDEIRLHNSATSATAAAVWRTLGFDVVEQVRRRTLTVPSPRHTPPPFAAIEAG